MIAAIALGMATAVLVAALGQGKDRRSLATVSPYPRGWLGRERRRRAVRRELPYLADFLAVAVEAGLSMDAALDRAVPRLTGPLAEALQAYLAAVSRGSDRKSALAELSGRSGVVELQRLVVALQAAEQFGLPVSAVLRVQAQGLRDRMRQRAEEQAMKLPVKLLLPLVLLIFPALLLILLGPALIQVSRTLGGL